MGFGRPVWTAAINPISRIVPTHSRIDYGGTEETNHFRPGWVLAHSHFGARPVAILASGSPPHGMMLIGGTGGPSGGACGEKKSIPAQDR